MQTAPTNLSDEELARQSQAGSLSSFEELVHRHEARIFRLLAKCCRNESQAEDLTQITFVTAYRSLHRYDPAHAFGSWLTVIARRKFIDHCRKSRLETPGEAFPEPSDPHDPATILDEREQHAGLWDQVRRLLGADQFGVLWLKYQEDLSIREIARVLRRTETSVKVLLFRARQVLVRNLPASGSRACGRRADGSAMKDGRAPVAPGWGTASPISNLSAEIK